TYTVTYADANFNASTLAAGNVTMNATGTATASIGVSGTGTTRTVTLSSVTGIGALGISLAAGTGTDTAGNAAPAAGPSATFPAAGAAKSGSALTITATFNEPMKDSPVVKLAISAVSGGTALLATNMTKVDSTHYTYLYTVQAGSGTATVTMSIGTDMAGNLITAAPTSGGSFIVDNVAPTASIAYSPTGLVKQGTPL